MPLRDFRVTFDLAPDVRTSCSSLVPSLSFTPMCLSCAAASPAALWLSVSCEPRDLGAELPSHGLHTQPCRIDVQTDTPQDAHAPALYLSTLSYVTSQPESQPRTHTHTAVQTPIHSGVAHSSHLSSYK